MKTESEKSIMSVAKAITVHAFLSLLFSAGLGIIFWVVVGLMRIANVLPLSPSGAFIATEAWQFIIGFGCVGLLSGLAYGIYMSFAKD